MHARVQASAGIASIRLVGDFIFSAQQEFNSSYAQPLAADEIREIEIDMEEVRYLDSAALGMLLLLREKAQQSNKEVFLSNCRGRVQQILDVVNFYKVFPIR